MPSYTNEISRRSLFKYARYFAKRHPKVIEDERAIEIILRLEEDARTAKAGVGRHITVTAIGTRLNGDEDESEKKNVGVAPEVDAMDFAMRRSTRLPSYEPGVPDILNSGRRLSKRMI